MARLQTRSTSKKSKRRRRRGRQGKSEEETEPLLPPLNKNLTTLPLILRLRIILHVCAPIGKLLVSFKEELIKFLRITHCLIAGSRAQWSLLCLRTVPNVSSPSVCSRSTREKRHEVGLRELRRLACKQIRASESILSSLGNNVWFRIR